MPQAEGAVERALRSFAAAVAGEIAHELSNRLATMRETVGLLEDLARAGKGGAAGTARAHAALDDQVARALNVVRSLGALGSALGAAAPAFDAGAAVTELLALNERWARRRSLSLAGEVAAGLPRSAGDPALFLCLAHRLLTRSGESLQDGGGVVVRVGRAGDGIAVRLATTGSRRDGAAPSAEEERIDRELAGRLGGTLTLGGGGATTIGLIAAQEQGRP